MTTAIDRLAFDNRTIYDLKLHETVTITSTGIRVMRVPSGWLYTSKIEGQPMPLQTFVPYCEKEIASERRGRA